MQHYSCCENSLGVYVVAAQGPGNEYVRQIDSPGTVEGPLAILFEGTAPRALTALAALRAHCRQLTKDDDITEFPVNNGSSMCKASFSGNHVPQVVFLKVACGAALTPDCGGDGSEGLYMGDEAQSKRVILSQKYPIEYSIELVITGMMEKIWHDTFYELCVAPELMTKGSLNLKANVEKMAQMMSKTFMWSSKLCFIVCLWPNHWHQNGSQ
ncbi:Actin, cytoplasmic 1 [Galemys pyrenaicus]|uniref:Actin, cytoplasmic 1 n=1 Tax=Galemys pyrenaicus TaxID=202257 RepID=A0A8J6AK62_GALPY|nr:Actin, cytoplasmic 1 [Galemys pyrenaicus]